MIERYTRPEMAAVWSEQRKLDTWLQVELAAVDALEEQGVVPGPDAASIRERAYAAVERIDLPGAQFRTDVASRAVGVPG